METCDIEESLEEPEDVRVMAKVVVVISENTKPFLHTPVLCSTYVCHRRFYCHRPRLNTLPKPIITTLRPIEGCPP